MRPRTRLLSAILVLIASATSDNRGASLSDPDKDPQMQALLHQARKLIDEKKRPAGIKKCDEVIVSFKTHYAKRKEKIYCARSSVETLAYLLKAAAAINEGKFEKGKQSAIALSSTWSDAYFLKAYALQDLGRVAEAKGVLELAISLSPWNSRYLSELGSIYQLERNWSKARGIFIEAEEHAQLSPDESKTEELGRARRGLAYVFVELGKLDKAEEKYKQCLAADSNDTRAARELEYVRGLRAKTKSR